ncbi:hypothetical protein Hanom_Chr00s000020g01616811 [Helianthus anomalus]
MWYPGKTHSHPDLLITSFLSLTIYLISGRNFFQVGDDVTNRVLQFLYALLYCAVYVFDMCIVKVNENAVVH